MFTTFVSVFWLATGSVDLVKHPELSFEQHISNKLHKPLKIRNKKSIAAKPFVPTSSLNAVKPKYIKFSTELSAQSMYHPTRLETKIVNGDDGTLVVGTKHKDAILVDYESKYKTSKDHVVTKLKGKHCIDNDIHVSKRMRPSIDKCYRVIELTVYNVITTILKEYSSTFDKQDLLHLALVNKDFSVMIPSVIRWLKIDFHPLCEPRYDYESQTSISIYRVEMASAAMVHFGLDPGKFVRWLGGEYTGYYRDVNKILTAIRPHIESDDYGHLKRILT